MPTADLDNLPPLVGEKVGLPRIVDAKTSVSESSIRIGSYSPGIDKPRRWYISRRGSAQSGEEYLHIDGEWRNKAIVTSKTGEDIESGLYPSEKRAREILAQFTSEPIAPLKPKPRK